MKQKIWLSVSMLVIVMCLMSIFPSMAAGPGVESVVTIETLELRDPAPGVTTPQQLEAYLNENFSVMSTSLRSFDFKGYITVHENTDQHKSYDYVISIPMPLLSNYFNDLQTNINYTDEQRAELKQAMADYQKTLASISISTFPTKKIRGGFLTAGYVYPNIRQDYYEITRNGWKNYRYKNEKAILNFYKDTWVETFEWYDFGIVEGTLDLI